VKHAKSLFSIGLAILVTLPSLLLHFLHLEVSPPVATCITGTAILGASFILLWASDAAKKDISQAMALAVIALIAVLPEYAVDMYFTWQAGQNPASDYASFAIANMTGANRLLIGVAWSLIALLYWYKTKRAVKLEEDRKTEILFLGMATAYAFLIPLKGSLDWYDGLAFIGLYVWYVRVVCKRPAEEEELHGPAEMLGNLPKMKRRTAVVSLLVFAALVILFSAESFSEGLIGTGRMFGINEFLLVQWLAPIASETPEFALAIMFTLRGQPGIGLGSLISSKLNQWTLLVGMIPGVYALSSGTLAHPIPMGAMQMDEILLTAAQSLFAVTLLLGMRLGFKQAMVLFVLFFGQFVSPLFLDQIKEVLPGAYSSKEVHDLFSDIYLLSAVYLLAKHRKEAKALFRSLRIEVLPPKQAPTS